MSCCHLISFYFLSLLYFVPCFFIISILCLSLFTLLSGCLYPCETEVWKNTLIYFELFAFFLLLPDIEMNDTSSPSSALPHLTAKAYLQGQSDIALILGRLRPCKWLTRTQMLSQCAALHGGTLQPIKP